MWNSDILQLVEWHKYLNWIMVTLSMNTTCMILTIINVYMPSNYGEKTQCWGSLLDLAKENPPQNLIIAGDFNITRRNKEKRWESVVRDQFREKMADLISYLDLFDVPPSPRYPTPGK
jgi:endonuclease/exonuclease/phosphatase family metal-dependent hydrolase